MRLQLALAQSGGERGRQRAEGHGPVVPAGHRRWASDDGQLVPQRSRARRGLGRCQPKAAASPPCERREKRRLRLVLLVLLLVLLVLLLVLLPAQ